MALITGDVAATNGMAQAIYNQMETNLEPDLGDMAEEDLDKVRTSWRKLSHAIAMGVIGHLLSNLEIRDVETQGDVDNVAISGSTGSADPGSHSHGSGSLTGAQTNVTFTQSNEGTGLIA